MLMLMLAWPLASPPPAWSQAGLQSVFEADAGLGTDPADTLTSLRLIGAQWVRVAVSWAEIAPDPESRSVPRGFRGGDPAAYPAANWTKWDQIVRDAAADHIGLDFDLMGAAPRWALGPGEPAKATNLVWEPSPSMYGAFVHAVAERYSGRYDPRARALVPGAPNDLPRVSFWSVWNEPDYGPSLAPQGVPGHLKVENSPRMYRHLIGAAWTALHQTGHSSDVFLFGELAPRGMPFWGVFSGMKPLTFLRTLYCVDSHYRRLTGAAAAIRGCPATAAGSRRFRASNAGLFEASGVSDHPYMRWYPPNHEQFPDPDYSTLGEIGNLVRALDRLQRVYGSNARLPVWDTEFGYLTDPPKHDNQLEPGGRRYPWVSPATAARYLNWAEFISWRDRRVQSFDQYQLSDPEPATMATDWGGYASGLITYGGQPKVTYDAWRLPLYVPVNTPPAGFTTQVWGCVRPAHYALLDTGRPQTARLQFEPVGTSSFMTLQTITVSPTSCYFDIQVAFPSSGALRLAYTYPTLDTGLGDLAPAPTIYSRSVSITLQ
jgi:hypothetical protein